ncbi:MAG: outer membrane lipoprotein-sorting protein [Myxococcota bacterium]|nr:outer membrane lipoprotein-sorting protein [Myxococcota bacterium]
MHRSIYIPSLTFIFFASTSAAAPISPDSRDARAIMEAVESQPEGDQSKGRLVMTITDNAGRSRQRVVQSRAMNFAEGRKQLMRFESPADVRNISLLSVDFKSGDRDDLQWLYLPSMSKLTRISSGEKSGSFMGTDLSYSDMTEADINHYDYRLVKPEVVIRGEPCWQIESRPKTQRARDETGYVKTHIWISKSKLVPLQLKAWVREGRRLKYIQFRDYKQIDGLWVAQLILAQTRKGRQVESSTSLKFTELSFGNSDVIESLFQQNRLEQGF